MFGAAGLVSDAFLPALLDEHVATVAPAASDSPAQPAAEVREVLVHARWLAAVDGRVVVEPRDLAAAIFWDGTCAAGRRARDAGTEFGAAYRALMGRDAPAAIAPDPDPVFIDVADLARVQVNLERLVPEGVDYGFNWDDRRAWLWSEREDFADLVDRALALRS